jgi:hypothetical protein
LSIQSSQGGNISVEAFPSDYRKVGGVLVAYKTTMNLLSQERVMTLTSVAYNTAIPDSVFAIPADVQKLLKK